MGALLGALLVLLAGAAMVYAAYDLHYRIDHSSPDDLPRVALPCILCVLGCLCGLGLLAVGCLCWNPVIGGLLAVGAIVCHFWADCLC